jgi:hypothetical protein
LIHPLYFTFLSGAAVAVTLLVVCFFAVGDYTKRSTVTASDVAGSQSGQSDADPVYLITNVF